MFDCKEAPAANKDKRNVMTVLCMYVPLTTFHIKREKDQIQGHKYKNNKRSPYFTTVAIMHL